MIICCGSFRTYPLLRTSESLTDAQVFKIHYHRLRDLKEIQKNVSNMSPINKFVKNKISNNNNNNNNITGNGNHLTISNHYNINNANLKENQ